jgi:predicted alpha/beta-hydrolase family hydrolase
MSGDKTSMGQNIKRDRTSRVINVQRYKNVYGTKRLEGQKHPKGQTTGGNFFFVMFSMYILKK